MLDVILCIAVEHDLKLVVLAAIICILGSWLSFRLFDRGLRDRGLITLGWNFLAATAAGSSVWSTHFIAILAFKTGAPVSFDPVLTIVSLLIAIGSIFVGMAATSLPIPFSAAAGGTLVGLGIAAMHYAGMNAYHIEGLVNWSRTFVIASVIVSIAASILALELMKRERTTARPEKAAGIFALGIIGLHFTGMAAMTVTPLVLRGMSVEQGSYLAMAMAIALACLVIAGTGLTSFVIDHRMRSDSDRKLCRMALYDSLTGLPNRPNFTDKLLAAIDHSNRTGEGFACIGMDLDRFKEINDLRGHAAGDAVLGEVGERLASLKSDRLFVARLGGDEFAVICRCMNDKLVFEDMMQIKNALVRPITLGDGTEVSIGVSLGAAFYPADAPDAQELVSRADLAMYRAKASPITSICFYDSCMDEVVRQRKALAADLKNALANGELELFYQVQNAVDTEEVIGFEVLLRWRHPVRGMVSPVDFIPIAEESGLIMDIGRWVLQTACEQASRWPNDLRIAVNLSPIQLSDPKLPAMVRMVLEETGLAPNRLELELTESSIIENRERTLSLLLQVKALGVTIALDDFGTGYSSLETLRTFPFNKIKLDRSFMNQIEESPQARAIIRAVLAIGKSMDVPVLAEGVETRSQLEILRQEGCDAMQGYLLGRPVPHDDIVASFGSGDEVGGRRVATLRAIIKTTAEPQVRHASLAS
ncbi:putative bifunctional diguanylate cyclase/phosphodiesterase [Rhizobium sp. C4]|uniref:putative bifunctional diguanylate cyclase/phosphodiesterase n=1 Tax=Rhizobium sp. C4 TaxID=1349800 RepID=UPI001E594D04|nr:bifunctional diguanylate cyclase/phosphodiesterase [Rhizobium sp. C4]MCD2175805.1 EAL domain-containing protein [Rhizobium sp. C4]